MQEHCKYSALIGSCLTWYLSLDVLLVSLRSAFHVKEHLNDCGFFFSLKNLFGITPE